MVAMIVAENDWREKRKTKILEENTIPLQYNSKDDTNYIRRKSF